MSLEETNAQVERAMSLIKEVESILGALASDPHIANNFAYMKRLDYAVNRRMSLCHNELWWITTSLQTAIRKQEEEEQRYNERLAIDYRRWMEKHG